jgi:hypothetical protein
LADHPPHRAPVHVSRNRSGASVVQSAVDLKTWQQRQPTVDEVRPSHCPACGAASCPVGGPLGLHGHGRRERQVRGPQAPGERAVLQDIRVQRYRCVRCTAVIVVVPREMCARRLYSLAAIGLALALWGLVQTTAAEVRQRISPAQIVGAAAVTGWVTLRRWARAVAQQRLFPSLPDAGPGATLRQVAAQAAAALGALSDPTTRPLGPEARAFFGAAHAA